MTESTAKRTGLRQGRRQRRADRFSFASGRIRALELRLIDSEHLARLLDAQTSEAVLSVLTECGYPSAEEPEISLAEERVRAYAEIAELMPEAPEWRALLTFHDGHNLKAILKSLVPSAYPAARPNERAAGPELRRESADLAAAETPDIPALSDLQISLEGVAWDAGRLDDLMLRPANVDPVQLRQAIIERRPELIPAWLQDAAATAIASYARSFDLAQMDELTDQATWAQALRLSAEGCRFLADYLLLDLDLINLATLLRVRGHGSAAADAEPALIPGGRWAVAELLALLEAPPEDMRLAYAHTDLAPLVAYATQDALPEHWLAHFGVLADELRIAWLRRAQTVVTGPEVPLAWLLARLYEIRNVQIILVGLRNRLPSGQIRSLLRPSYLVWR